MATKDGGDLDRLDDAMADVAMAEDLLMMASALGVDHIHEETAGRMARLLGESREVLAEAIRAGDSGAI